MIEQVAVDNDIVFKLNGQLTASRSAPVHQAEKWFQRCQQRMQDKQSIIVLGAGSGYHLEKLQNHYEGKNILVIDTDQCLLKEVKKARQIKDVEILLFEDIQKLQENSAIIKAVKGSYAVVSFYTENRQTKSIFNFLKYFLLARNTLGFNFISSLRGERFLISSPEQEDELLSVKNLHKHFCAKLNILKDLVN